MALYHPPQMITANQSPVITADLGYENHGKCGNTRILTSVAGEDSTEEQLVFDAELEGNGNAWRMDIIQLTGMQEDCPCGRVGYIEKFVADNLSDADMEAFVNIPITRPFSIMANIRMVRLSVQRGLVVVLYMDCDQS